MNVGYDGRKLNEKKKNAVNATSLVRRREISLHTTEEKKTTEISLSTAHEDDLVKTILLRRKKWKRKKCLQQRNNKSVIPGIVLIVLQYLYFSMLINFQSLGSERLLSLVFFCDLFYRRLRAMATFRTFRGSEETNEVISAPQVYEALP